MKSPRPQLLLHKCISLVLVPPLPLPLPPVKKSTYVLIVIAKRSSNNLEVNAVSVTKHLHGLKSPMVISVDSRTVRNAVSIRTPAKPVSAMTAVTYLVSKKTTASQVYVMSVNNVWNVPCANSLKQALTVMEGA